MKKSRVNNHIQSVKHENSNDALKAKIKREKSISEAIQQHNSEINARGETLPMENQVHHVKVVECFLRATVPLSKIQHFRKLFEETTYQLTDRHHMSDLNPIVLKQEKSRKQSKIFEQDVSIIFDGTSQLGEALAIVLHFVACEWSIEWHLIRVELLSASLKEEEIA